MWIFYYFNFKRNYDVSKPTSPCILLNKTINLINNETKSKMEIPYTVLERQTLCFSSLVGARERKRGHILHCLFCLKDIFFKIFVLSQCIVYWMHFQNIHTFYNWKNITSYSFLLAFKIDDSLQYMLKINWFQ